MVQIQFHQGEPLGHKKEKPPPVSPPSPPPIRRVTVITKDEDTLRSVQHFLWMVRLYGTVVFQTSATIATTILFMLIPWRVTTPYLRDTLPFWSTLLPCALRCHAYWLERRRRPGTLMLVMVYTTLTTISVSTIGLCFDRTVVIQAYVLSSMLCVWCTGLAWLMAWNMQRRLAILCLPQRDDLVAFGSEALVVTFFRHDRHGSVDFGASSLSGLQQSALFYIVGSAVPEDPM